MIPRRFSRKVRAVNENDTYFEKEEPQAVGVEEVFTTKLETAKLLRRTPRTLEIWMRDGRIPFIKIGRTVLFERNAVLQAVRAYQVGGHKKGAL